MNNEPVWRLLTIQRTIEGSDTNKYEKIRALRISVTCLFLVFMVVAIVGVCQKNDHFLQLWHGDEGMDEKSS